MPPPTKMVSTSCGSDQERLDLLLERRQVSVRQMVDSRERGKVAVTTLVRAERNVHVGRTGPAPSRLAGALERLGRHGTASTKRISRTRAFSGASILIVSVMIDDEHPWQAPVKRTWRMLS